MKFTKLFCSLLSVGLLASVVSIPVHAEEQNPYADENGFGVVVTRPTSSDLEGEYGEAYAAAGYKATFKVDASQLDFGNSNVDIDSENFELWVGGTIQFYDESEIKTYLEPDSDYANTQYGHDSFNIGNASTINIKAQLHSAYDYREGYFNAGFNVARADYVNFKSTYLSGEHKGEQIPEGEYNLSLDHDDIVSTDPSTNSVIYKMEKVEGEDDVYTISLPVPSTEFLYKYFAFPYTGFNFGREVNVTSKEEADTQGYAAAFDPGNMPEINGTEDPGWSYFFVGDGSEALKTQEYIFPRTDGQTGTWEYVSYKDVNGNDQWLNVYLPYGYDEAETYHVIYLSHGGGGDETEWSQVGAAGNIMDNLIAEGLIDPVVVVCMNNTTIWNAGERDSSGVWEYTWNNMKDYLVPFVEENYSVSTEASGRAMAGLSYGGRTATNFLLKDPEFFGYVGAFSGFECLASEWEDVNVEAMKNVYIFTAAGNVDFGLGYYGQDPATDARKAYTLAEFNAMLDNLGVAHESEILYGCHDWGVWRGALTSFALNIQKLWGEEVTNPGVEVNPGDDVDNTPTEPTTPSDPATTVDPTTEVTEPVNTGDSTNIVMPVVLLGVAAVAFVAVKKRKVLK